MQASDFGLARSLFPKATDVVASAFGGALPSLQVPATAVTSSEDGSFLAVVEADFIADEDAIEDEDIDVPDGYSLIEVPSSANVNAGDSVLLTLQGNKALDAGSAGWGDRVNSLAAAAETLAQEAQAAASAASTAASDAQSIAAAVTMDAANAQAAADTAQGTATEAQASADAAQATASDAQSQAQATQEHFWADEGGAHVSTENGKAHEAGAGYNMTLGATGTTTGIILDHDAETLASFTPTALNFYADGKLAAGYTKEGVSLYAQDANDVAQQVAAFTDSGVTFFDGTGNAAANVVASFGKHGATLGSTGGKMVSITDESLAFVDAGEVVASVDGNALVIANASVSETLVIGGFAWIPRSNGNLALKWMGV